MFNLDMVEGEDEIAPGRWAYIREISQDGHITALRRSISELPRV
jgi:hypothetical protein